MANIRDAIAGVEKLDPELARSIDRYVKEHSFGLVFEDKLPESVRLYTKVPAVGDTVNILPPRGAEETDWNRLSWLLREVADGTARIERDDETMEIPLQDVVTIVGYRDAIYPGFRELDRIERGSSDDPYHMVLDAENYHALQALAYCYPGKVDCIYIDPPYNTGEKTWKYNNDYVDRSDRYRHSKWLAFMERRLRLAKQLLNPRDSVLICAVDDNECHRLGLLLEQVFPEAKIQMVTTVINPSGNSRGAGSGDFSSVNEFLFFVRLGNAKVQPWTDTMLPIIEEDGRVHPGPRTVGGLKWESFLRSGRGNNRDARPNLFYPIYVDRTSMRIVGAGEPSSVPLDSLPHEHDGYDVAWPIKKDGGSAIWHLERSSLMSLLDRGYAYVSSYDKKRRTYTIQYLPEGAVDDIESGRTPVERTGMRGQVVALSETVQRRIPKTVWNMRTHNAGTSGTNLLSEMLPNRHFQYPKSLYAVADTLRFFVADKPDALILDFFAGSGTTLHATCLLNKEDGGHRRAICVTNNEVSSDEAAEFTRAGLRPGDPEWEARGIAHYITWPRVRSAISGVNADGAPLRDAYRNDGSPMAGGFEANAIFFQMTYESEWPIRLDRAFNAIAPILWTQSGCRGPIIERRGRSFATTDFYGVLFDYNQASKLCEKVKSKPTVGTVYVVTDDPRRYSNMCRRLPDVEVRRLYENYLRTFEIRGEGGLDR